MVSELKAKTRDVMARAFPERQIYLRTSGNVRYVAVKPVHQMVAAGGAFLVAGWCVYATAATMLRGPAEVAGRNDYERRIAKVERWLHQARTREAAAISLLEERSAAFASETGELERRHDSLAQLLAGLTGEGSVNLAALRGDGAGVLVRASIDEAEPRIARGSVEPVVRTETASFRARVDGLRTGQEQVLATVENIAVDRAERARGVLRLTGVGTARLFEESGLGGPLIELPPELVNAEGEREVFELRVVQVAARLEEMRRLESLMRVAPLGTTVGVPYRLTSGFGVRSDPFTGRYASHEGLDFAAYRGAPIISAAPGVVTVAERRNAYGNVVEIDHGFGFRTRYAHLDRISVQVGAEVGMGTVVGAMGSTGRSTGPHLHYEVWFRGKTYDPINFLKAGKHVHETDQAG
jgi:murein DD-endopeptidase MepM/ murein hydrolase activator NlpD